MPSPMTALPALLAVLAASPGESLAVVEVEAADAMIGLSFQVTNAIVEEAKTQGFQVLTSDELRKKLDEKTWKQLKRCAGSVACAAQYLQGTGARKAVLGTLSRDEKNYVLKLWYFDLAGLKVIADVDRQVLIAARRFQKDVQQAVPPLLRGEKEARGTLVITANVPNVQVTMNGEFLGTPPITVTLKPGKYEVKADKKKYLPVTRLFTVEANQDTREELRMLLRPGESPDEDLVPALVKKPEVPAAENHPAAIGARTWAAGGLTVVAAGAGTFFALAAKDGDDKLLAGYDATRMQYQGSRATALQVQQNALWANIAWGVTAAAAVTTVVFSILDATAADGVQVAPTVTPGGAGVVVGGHF